MGRNWVERWPALNYWSLQLGLCDLWLGCGILHFVQDDKRCGFDHGRVCRPPARRPDLVTCAKRQLVTKRILC